MSLLTYDGFDGYDAIADLAAFGKWYAAAGTVSSVVRVGTGKSILLGTANNHLAYNFSADQAGKTIYSGFAYQRNGGFHANAAGIGTPLFSLYQTASSEANPQIFVRLNSGFRLEIVSGTTILAVGSTVLANGAAYYIEVKVLVANSGGICEVKINEIVDVTYTGDTQFQSNNSVLRAGIGYAASYSPPGYVDDFYMLNSDGALNNTYKGEQLSEMMTLNSDSSIAWTRNTGASDYLAVDDAVGAPDDDTTYTASSVSGARNEYGLSDLTNVNAVAAVKIITRAKKDDVNPRSFKHGIKSGTTQQEVTYSLGTGYVTYSDIFETSDGVNTPFNATTINSLLAAHEVV